MANIEYFTCLKPNNSSHWLFTLKFKKSSDVLVSCTPSILGLGHFLISTVFCVHNLIDSSLIPWEQHTDSKKFRWYGSHLSDRYISLLAPFTALCKDSEGHYSLKGTCVSFWKLQLKFCCWKDTYVVIKFNMYTFHCSITQTYRKISLKCILAAFQLGVNL